TDRAFRHSRLPEVFPRATLAGSHRAAPGGSDSTIPPATNRASGRRVSSPAAHLQKSRSHLPHCPRRKIPRWNPASNSARNRSRRPSPGGIASSCYPSANGRPRASRTHRARTQSAHRTQDNIVATQCERPDRRELLSAPSRKGESKREGFKPVLTLQERGYLVHVL